MAIRKTILDIDLGGEKLKEALATLAKYKALAVSIPAAVVRAGKSVVAATGGGAPPAAGGSGAGGNNLYVGAYGQAVVRHQRGVTQGLQEQENVTRRTAINWRSIANSVRETGRTLQGYTGTLLKWTGVAAALQGLALGGSVYGLERLASSAYAGRRSSSGLGIGYGEQQAFGLAYERLINSGSLLQGVSQARGNLSSEAAGSLYSLGINPQGPGNTGSMANDVLLRVRQLVQQTPESELGILAQNYRLGEHGFDVESLRRLKNTPDEEFGRYQQDYARRTRQLDLQDSVLRRWQDLDVQLEATSSKLKNSLLTALEKLAEPLAKLSESLSDFLQKVATSGALQSGIAYLAKGINWLADYIGKDEFKEDMKLFAESIGMLAQKTVAALRYLGLVPDPAGAASGSSSGAQYGPGLGPQHNMPQPPSAADLRRARREQQYGSIGGAIAGVWDAIVSPFTGGKSPEIEHYLKAIKMIESGSAEGDYNIVNPKSGAIGAYQIMPANVRPWTRQYLGREMSPEEFRGDKDAQDAVARARWEEMLRRYGNPQDAASEWQSGVDLRTATRQGRTDGNMTTPQYVQQFNRNLEKQGVSININNNTGGNATVTVAPLGVGGLGAGAY